MRPWLVSLVVDQSLTRGHQEAGEDNLFQHLEHRWRILGKLATTDT